MGGWHMKAIEVSELHKTFGRSRGARAALDGVSFSIAKGEMVALIGASGSGKSTLIRHIAGLVAADKRSGQCRVSVLGRPVQEGGRVASDVRKSRAETGVIFQQFNLVNRLSLLTNTVIGLLGRIPVWRGTLCLFNQQEKLVALRALERVGMADKAGQRASTLSGGQQQRGAIARCLVQKARVVLADEPIASLDPESARRVMETLAEINRTDEITVVVSLHQVDYAVKFCRRAIALREGSIVYEGPTEALTAEFLGELYGADSNELILTGAFDGPEDSRRPDLAVAAV